MPKPRDEAKIEAIFQAALKVVLKEGYAGLKMKDVAAEAGMATGTLYIYFTNKEELINELFVHLKTAKTQRLMAAYDPADPFPVTFKKLWISYLDITLSEPERTIFIEQFARSPYLTEASRKVSDQLLKPIADILDWGIRQHLVQDLPTELLISQLLGPVYEMVKLHHDGKIELTPSRKEQCFQMAWNAVRK